MARHGSIRHLYSIVIEQRTMSGWNHLIIIYFFYYQFLNNMNYKPNIPAENVLMGGCLTPGVAGAVPKTALLARGYSIMMSHKFSAFHTEGPPPFIKKKYLLPYRHAIFLLQNHLFLHPNPI